LEDWLEMVMETRIAILFAIVALVFVLIAPSRRPTVANVPSPARTAMYRAAVIFAAAAAVLLIRSRST
jgi:hypothetical protein